MFSSKCYILFLSLAGYLGSHHHGLIQAKETQVISSMAIKTSLNVQIKSSTKMYGHRAAASFTTEPIYSTFHVPTEQITILETASASSENSKQPRSVTPHVYSLASHVVSSITVLTGASILQTSVQPSRAVLYSRNFTAIFPSNSTSFPQGSENSAIDDCSAGNVGEKSCDTYVTRWVDFYLNVGGWIMLSVVLVGIAVLVTTHIHGRKRRKEIKRLPQLMYRELTRNRGRWV